MTHSETASDGATETHWSRVDGTRAETNRSSGWRKATAGLAAAESYATSGERASIPKSRAFIAVKRIGAHLGLKPVHMMLLDTLGAFTQDQDWKAGCRPIVWASNAYLIEQTGLSLSALKRHTRRLAENGIIAFKDSPNGKRWGRRSDCGNIIEAYGFDLSPLAARVEEFEDIFTEIKIERELCNRLKRQITTSRRNIRSKIETAAEGETTGPWSRFQTLFDELLARLPKEKVPSGFLNELNDNFQCLLEEIDKVFLAESHITLPVDKVVTGTKESVQKPYEVDPEGFSNEPHIQDTNQLQSLRSSHNNEASPKDDRSEGSNSENRDGSTGRKADPIDLSLLMNACSNFSSWIYQAYGYVKNWENFPNILGMICKYVGISDDIYCKSITTMGKERAITAIALIFEKCCNDEIKSPTAYLSGMIRKEERGELHLDRSLHGRLAKS